MFCIILVIFKYVNYYYYYIVIMLFISALSTFISTQRADLKKLLETGPTSPCGSSPSAEAHKSNGFIPDICTLRVVWVQPGWPVSCTHSQGSNKAWG